MSPALQADSLPAEPEGKPINSMGWYKNRHIRPMEQKEEPRNKTTHKQSTHIGEGNGTPFQYSCLENPRDGGAWWATVHGGCRVRHD